MKLSAAVDIEPPSGSATRLAVSALSFRYPAGDGLILKDIDFTIVAGEVWGVLGPNGSGKSTMLNALLGVAMGERGGTIALPGGTNLRTGVGYATQQTALYQQLTVEENLRHAARLTLPRARVAGAVTDAVEEFGLATVVRTQVYRLSGGWERMAHLATSLVHRPTLRMLDEPTTGLDFEARARLVALVHRWRADGAALIVTSHYPEDIQEMCTHAMVLKDGTLARRSPMAALLSSHQPQLVSTVQLGNGLEALRRAAPTCLQDLRDAADSWIGQFPGSTPLRSVHTTGTSLRSLLEADPDLRGLLDE